ncbi:hypothetical protein [Acinetobacter indicus]|uniref:hypothetical protein n=1 Tax=Acinetobacter indicus TaxID=756892 RepID=UPI0011788129|nr:hypothetical protein [Acinetobacter indicus]
MPVRPSTIQLPSNPNMCLSVLYPGLTTVLQLNHPHLSHKRHTQIVHRYRLMKPAMPLRPSTVHFPSIPDMYLSLLVLGLIMVLQLNHLHLSH